MILLTLVAAATALSGVLTPDADLQFHVLPSLGITGLESRHRIEFPDRIIFNLAADSQDDVRSVRLYYSIGNLSTRVYLRPGQFRNDGDLAAEFVIRTRNGGFIPPGVEIEYYYVFTDSEGKETTSVTFSLRYLDPRYDWRRVEFEDFTVFWHDRPEGAVRQVGRDVSTRLAHVKRLLGLQGDYDFPAVLVNGRGESLRSYPPISQTSRDTQLYGGFAFGDYGSLVLGGLSREGLIHELTHLMLAEAVDSPRARVPDWLNEGLAMYFEGSNHREPTLAQAVRSGRLIPLRHMQNVPGRPEDVRLFYAQSASVVRFMLQEFGKPNMTALLNQLNGGRDLGEALEISYGLNVDQLDAVWRAYLSGADISDSRVGDIVGAAGTSLLVGGALGTTTIAILIRWLRSNLMVGDPDQT